MRSTWVGWRNQILPLDLNTPSQVTLRAIDPLVTSPSVGVPGIQEQVEFVHRPIGSEDDPADLPAGWFSGTTKWDELDYKKGIWTIPGSRMGKAGHHIPITNQINDLLESLRRVNGDQSMSSTVQEEEQRVINPAVINTYLIRIEQRILTAHGIRPFHSQWVKKFLDRLRHYPATVGTCHWDKVRQAYDRSQFWEERKKFMIAWCDALTAEVLIT